MEECATCKCGSQEFNIFEDHVRCCGCQREWFFSSIMTLVNRTQAQKIPETVGKNVS